MSSAAAAGSSSWATYKEAGKLGTEQFGVRQRQLEEAAGGSCAYLLHLIKLMSAQERTFKLGGAVQRALQGCTEAHY